MSKSKSKPKITMRRFSESQVADLEARAEGIATKTPGPRLEAVVDPTPEAPKAPSPSKLRRENFQGERINAYIPEELATKLRVRCAMERRSISDAMTAALEHWLD